MMNEHDIITVRTDDGEADITLKYAATSAIGKRSSQQDSLFVGEKDGALLAVICDGMGGMNGGERASELAVQMLVEAFFLENVKNIPEFYKRKAVSIDQAVYNLQEAGQRLGAGTTMISVFVKGNGLYWFSVGDSKVYLYRRGEMICPVPAHNYRYLLDQMYQNGQISETTYQNEQKKGEALISFLGIGDLNRMEVNMQPFRYEPEDTILLCSDGLYKSLSEQQIKEIIEQKVPIHDKIKVLLNSALEKGGSRQDNTSIILIET